VSTFGRMCGTSDPGSCIRRVLSFSIKTGYDSASGSWPLHVRQWSGSWSTMWKTSCLKSLNYRGFKSRWPWVIIGMVGLNFYTMLDEASWKETRLFGARLAFGSMRDALLQARLPCKWKVRRAPSMSVSNTRKREACVLGARLALGPVH
jgi:hypothetical protein